MNELDYLLKYLGIANHLALLGSRSFMRSMLGAAYVST